jgi:hypothetical protein
MFGAVGNGSTDDTAAIQAGIDAVASAGGGTLFFPPTSSYYKVTNQTANRALKVAASGVALMGAGYGSRIHNTSTDSSVVLVGDDAAGDTATYTGVTIANLRITQTLPHTADDWAAVKIRSVYGARVLNCDFDSIGIAISVQRRNAADARPEACIVQGNRINAGSNHRMGIEIFAAKGCQVIGNNITSTTTTALGIRSAGGLDNLFANNFIRGCNSGFSFQGGSGPTEPNHRAAVIGNRVVGLIGSSATGIILFNDIQDALIQGNYLDDFVYGVWLKPDTAGGTDRIAIKGNHLRTSASTTHAIFAGPNSGSNDNTDVRIIENYIEAGAGGNGIYLDTVTGRNHLLRNTVFLGSGGDGIQHVNSAAGVETYSHGNSIHGAGVLLANDNRGTGSGAYVNYNTQGIDDNYYNQTDGADVELAIFTPAQITANQNDYDPLFGSGRVAGTWRISSDAARNITGIAGGYSGRRLTLINVNGAANTITLTAEDALSAAANRIIGGFAIAQNGVARLIYDDTSARWRVA